MRNRLAAWGLSVIGSLLLHASVVFAAVYLTAAFLPFPADKPVEMEVVVLEMPAPDSTERPASDHSAASSSAPVPGSFPSTSAVEPVEPVASVKPAEDLELQERPVESPELVEAVSQERPKVTHRLESRSLVEIPVGDARPLLQRAPAIRRVVHRKAPPQAEAVPTLSSSVNDPETVTEKTVAVATREMNAAPQVQHETAEALVDRRERAVAAELLLSPPIAEVSPPEPVRQEVARVSPSPLTRLPVPETTEAVRESEKTNRPVAQGVPVKAPPSARPDFGWVAQALWHRLGQLKRYPHVARINRWEGTVVVRAVVKQDGDLADLALEQSSGHTALDEDALDLLRRVSPLPLQYALGRPELQIRVPITYKLE